MSENTTDNGYIIIPKFILTDTQLCKPNIRECYGLILSLSFQDGYCFASNSYLAEHMRCNIRSISRWVTTLTELGYIKVEYTKTSGTNDIKQRKIYPQKVLTDLSIRTDTTVQGVLTDLSIPYGQSCPGGTDSDVQDNNKYNNKNIILNNKKENIKRKSEPKTKYAEFVSMTNAEYQALIDSYGEADTNSMIEILDNYKGSCGKKYKSDYRAIKNWVVGELEKRKKNNSTGGNNGTYQQDDYAAIGWA